MKKLVFGLIATVMLSLFSTKTSAQNFTSREVKDQQELDLISSYVSKFGDFNKEFNFNDIKIVSQENQPEIESIIINSYDFNIKNSINKAITFTSIKGVYGKVYYMKTTVYDNSKNIIEYSDLENQLVISINVDKDKNLVTVNSVGKRGCGQAVADCITDAYSNHGWISAWAFVQTKKQF